MPPASKTRRVGGTSGLKKYSRTFKLASSFQQAFLDSQLEVGVVTTSLRDTRLILQDGWVDVHAAFLCALSPFFFKCVVSQGDNYCLDQHQLRSVILDDWTLEEIGPMIQLLYTGAVTLPSEEDINKLRGLLAFFEIEIQDELSSKKISSSGTTPSILIQSHQGKPSAPALLPGSRSNVDSAPTPVNVKPSTSNTVSPISGDSPPSEGVRTLRPRPKDKKPRRDYNDSDWEPETEEEEEPMEVELEVPIIPKVMASPAKRPPPQGVMSLPENINCASPAVSNTTSIASSLGSNSKKAKGAKKAGRKPWIEPNYGDKDWFSREARRCKICCKSFPIPSGASACVTAHGKLRCYFCFKVSSSTEKLFEHYKRRHRQAGKEGYILCPFCDGSVAYKSISCHMISLHLVDLKPSQEEDTIKDPPPSHKGVAVVVPARPKQNPCVLLSKTPSSTSSPSKRKDPPTPSPKKDKVQKLEKKKAEAEGDADPPTLLYETVGGEGRGGRVRPKNMDITIKRIGMDGKVWVWRIQKDYNTP